MDLLKGEIAEIWDKRRFKNLFLSVDIASAVLFRVVFGAIMLWEVTRYFGHNWIYRYWVQPRFNFAYGPFNFQPLPEEQMYLLWYALGILAFFILIGFLYRISTTLFFLLFTYTFLLEQARYLNHFYLVVVISFIIIFLPLHRSFSVDSLIFKKIKSDTVSTWVLWFLRFVIAVPYFFGGIAKLNPDWLRGYPLTIWLEGSTDFPLIGRFFEERWMMLFLSYSGLLLDLLIVPFLLFKKTRWASFIFISLFHLMNSQLWTIGIFPWFMMLATTIFFRPSWPREMLENFKVLKPVNDLKSFSYSPLRQKVILWAFGIFIFIQCALPFRHLFIPGNVHWTEEGHRYAWHMKLRSKSGITTFYVQDVNTGERIEVDARGYIERWQVSKMNGKPYMIWEFAQYLKDQFRSMGAEVAIFVDARASLNGRAYQQIIAPNFDITKVPKPWFGNADWILPLNVPLEEQW